MQFSVSKLYQNNQLLVETHFKRCRKNGFLALLKKCFCFLPLLTFRCIHSSLVCTKSRGVIFFACISLFIKALDHFQRIVISKLGSDDEMFLCSLEPAIGHLCTSKKVPCNGMTSHGCLFQVINFLVLVLLNTFSQVIHFT